MGGGLGSDFAASAWRAARKGVDVESGDVERLPERNDRPPEVSFVVADLSHNKAEDLHLNTSLSRPSKCVLWSNHFASILRSSVCAFGICLAHSLLEVSQSEA